MFCHIRLYHQNIGIIATLHYLCGDIFGRSFAQIVNIRLESHSHHGNNRFTPMFKFKLQHRIFYFLRAPKGFIVIYFTGFCTNLRFHREISRDKIRIYCNTMTYHTTTRLKNIYTGVFISQINQFPDIYPGFITNQG